MNQESIEHLMHPKHLKDELRCDIQIHFKNEIENTVTKIKKWCNLPERSELKFARKQALACMDIHNIVVNLLTDIVFHCQSPLPFVSVASMINIGFETKMDNIRTTSELIALLEPIGVYTIDNNRNVVALIAPHDELLNRIQLSCYLPPMIEKPDTLYKNNDCGLKTIDKDSLILGNKENYHTGNISLDVLNTLNNNEYVIDDWVVENFNKPWLRPELSQSELSTLDKDDQEQYQLDMQYKEVFEEQFEVFYKLLKDKTVHFIHKVDKRGRVYTQGYHFNTQGTSFEKACISLKNQETVRGQL